MRPILWDDGTRFDDPNARWGDSGSYLLQPGDPGYVNTAPATGGGSAKKKGTENGSGGLLAYGVGGVKYRFENLVFHVERITPVLGKVSDPDIVPEEPFAALNGEGSAEEF